MKTLIRKLIIILVAAALPLPLYNIVFDPYGVIRKDYRHLIICPNERFAKTYLVLNHPTKWDSFIFGSSVVSQIPVEPMNALTGHRYYNMSYIAGAPHDHLRVLRLMIDRGVKISNLLIGLDVFSFRYMPPILLTIRTWHYPQGRWNTIDFYSRHLFLEPDAGFLDEVWFDGKEARYDLYTTGQYYFLKKERLIAERPDRHLAKFMAPPLIVCNQRLEKTMSEIRDIMRLCRDHGIAVRFFITPILRRWYLCDDIDYLNRVRMELAALGDYWDFTHLNSVTNNPFNYYDETHFRPPVGAMMVSKMFGKGEAAPADFGFLVTKENVGEYTRRCKREHDDARKKLDIACPPCIRGGGSL